MTKHDLFDFFKLTLCQLAMDEDALVNKAWDLTHLWAFELGYTIEDLLNLPN